MAIGIEQQARLDFALVLRRRWADRVYPQLRREFEQAGHGSDVTTTVHALPSYPAFAWLERGAQKLLWRAVDDAVTGEPQPANATGPARAVLDPALKLPGWYTEWDIHLQPGGVWSSERAARSYELGARLVMLGENDDYQFHRLFVETAVPRRPYRRIVDLGCGFGKSTWPFKQAFRDAEVIGIDLAAPCLSLAAERASERALEIEFRQADATTTGLEAGSADLVTSTMLLHELPPKLLPRLFEEAARLLAPGGLLRFLDFQLTGDPFRDLAMTEHGSRNNEPFIAPMMRADTARMAQSAGLGGVRWLAFDERGAGLLDELRWPRREEWHFPWAVLEAEKPS